MPLFHIDLQGWVAPADLFVQLYSNSPNAFWLDREHNLENPFSVIGSGLPVHEFSELELFKSDEDLELPFEFRPGLVGAVGFEGQKNLLLVDRAIVFDHRNRKMHFLAYAESEAEFKNWYRAAFLRLALVGGEVARYLLKHGDINLESVSARHSKSQYLKLIAGAQRSISNGDVYQLCLTNQINIVAQADPLAIFLKLRVRVPTPYSAYLKIGELAIVCASPEQFLTVSSSGKISTKPIKGTRPRSEDELEDSEIAQELRSNSKERAENLMIVDLMRNDLGKVAEFDTVQVSSLFEIETYATVHQLVSRITAQLSLHKSAIDAFEAAFPGGSMTGAPKIRAIELIAELEAGPRGIYSGAIGSFSGNGSLELGMVIRTLIFEESQISIGVGGGITIDSDPEAEFSEIELKAKALLDVLGAPSPW